MIKSGASCVATRIFSIIALSIAVAHENAVFAQGGKILCEIPIINGHGSTAELRRGRFIR